MSYLHEHNDIAVFSVDVDDSLHSLSNRYINANDKLSLSLKKSYFAIMVHGVVDSAVVGVENKKSIEWGIPALTQNIRNAWKSKGNDRAILMLSCYAGFAMARPLAINLKLPVVAGRSAVTIETNGNITCVKMSDESRNEGRTAINIGNRLDWVFVKPSGQLFVNSSAVLDKEIAVKFAQGK